MINLLKTISDNVLLKWLIIPLLLILSWFSLSIAYLTTSDFSSSVISYNHRGETQIPQEQTKIGSTEWSGQFKAKDNYLGIVSIDFAHTQKPIFDQISFMIKEKGANQWHEVNAYDARQFYFLSQFPFGFKVIEDSKDKIYEFKFVSQSGNQQYKSSFDKLNPIVISKYQYPKKLLISDPLFLSTFLYKKIVYSLSIEEYQNVILLFALPFILYMNLISLIELRVIKKKHIDLFLNSSATIFVRKQLKFADNPFVFLWIIFVFVNILSLNQAYDILSMLLLILWIVLILKLKIKHQASFFMAVILISFFPILYILNSESVLKKNSDWIFYFLLFGTIHALIELRFKNEKK
ncbi:hypothetical protein KJZ63_03580 [Patescibacteria group bacterium]|nr:hypothetical protein [Patescibacteria group bacterium]